MNECYKFKKRLEIQFKAETTGNINLDSNTFNTNVIAEKLKEICYKIEEIRDLHPNVNEALEKIQIIREQYTVTY